MRRRTKQERLELSLTAEGLDLLADEKERNRATRGEATRLTQFMKRGGYLIAEQIEGLGLIYRSRDRTAAPFSPTAVEKWCAKNRKALPDPG